MDIFDTKVYKEGICKKVFPLELWQFYMSPVFVTSLVFCSCVHKCPSLIRFIPDEI